MRGQSTSGRMERLSSSAMKYLHRDQIGQAPHARSSPTLVTCLHGDISSCCHTEVDEGLHVKSLLVLENAAVCWRQGLEVCPAVDMLRLVESACWTHPAYVRWHPARMCSIGLVRSLNAVA